MSLYTFVLEVNGGTFYSQVKAETFSIAPQAWITSLDETDLGDANTGIKIALESQLDEESPMPLDGIKNIWCLTFMFKNSLALVHFIQTVE